MTEWGRRDVRHPRRRRRRQAGHQRPGRHQPRHPHPARQLLLPTTGRARRCSSPATRSATRSTAGTRGTSTRIPEPQKRDFDGKYSWVMSPRWFDGNDHLALDTGGGPHRPAVVDGAVRPGRHRLRQGDRQQRRHQPAEDGAQARGHLRVEDPAVVQHHRAQPGPHLLPGLRGRLRPALRREGAGGDPGRPHQDLGDASRSPTRASAAGSPRRCAACCRTTWSSGTARSPTTTRTRRRRGTPTRVTATALPAPTRTPSQDTPIFEENGLENFKGIDIMRTVRSFDPCLPCGVHMYLGQGKVAEEGALARRWLDEPARLTAHTARRPMAEPDEPPGRRRPHRVAARTARSRRPTGWSRSGRSRSWCGSSSSSTVRPRPGSSSSLRRSRPARRLAADELVASLLVVHGLHPETLAERVAAALERVRPYSGPTGATSSCSGG